MQFAYSTLAVRFIIALYMLCTPGLNYVEDAEVVTEQPSLHHIMRVESISLFKASLARRDDQCITSTEFHAGGCKWVMKIYLNGKEAGVGNGNLSMSVRLVDKLKPGEIVKATFPFYVYNQKQDNYYRKQDLTGKHFSIMKKEWGISNVLPLDVFMDASIGYLHYDCCVFGVEISALKNE